MEYAQPASSVLGASVWIGDEPFPFRWIFSIRQTAARLWSVLIQTTNIILLSCWLGVAKRRILLSILESPLYLPQHLGSQLCITFASYIIQECQILDFTDYRYLGLTECHHQYPLPEHQYLEYFTWAPRAKTLVLSGKRFAVRNALWLSRTLKSRTTSLFI